MELGISVIICCYNSSLRLPETLKHLALQQVPANIPWEIIVIDNASTDSTAIVAKREWEKYTAKTVDFKILAQPVPGKNHAFDTGLKAAKYEYILTCDDDNWLFPDYIARAFQIMSSDEKLGALGGFGIFEPQQPVNKEMEGLSYYFVNGPQTWTNTDHWVYGAGSVYRKSILIELINNGWKQITTGRKGKSLICGEDVEICFMIYLSGYKVIADDKLKFKHFVPVKRQQITYIMDLCFWQSYTHVLLNSYYPILNNDKRPIKQIIDNWLIAATKTYLKNLILLILRKINLREKQTLERSISFNSIYGTWCSLLKNRKKIINHHEHTRVLLATRNSLN